MFQAAVRNRSISLAAAAIFLVTGCVGAAPALPASSTAPTGPATLTPTGPPAPLATAVPTLQSTPSSSAHPPTGGTALVDLVFTGPLQITARGSAGNCTIASGSGLARFEFLANDADYSGLGVSFNVYEPQSSSDYVDIKWVLTNTGMFYARPGPATPGTITLSADHHSVTIDTPLAKPGASDGEHLSGTITCP